MIRAYEGATVLDSNENSIGTVERCYAGENGALEFVLVELKNGSKFLPLDHAKLDESGLHVGYPLSTIEKSPDMSHTTGRPSAESVQAVRSYFKSDGSGLSNIVREEVPRAGVSGEEQQRTAAGEDTSVIAKGKTFFQKVMKDNIGMLASVVAWSVLTSVVPIIVGLLALSGLALRNASTRSTVVSHLSSALQGVLTPKDLNSLVSASINHTGLLGIIGFLGVLWGGANVGGAISTTFQAIFETNGRNFFKEKLIDMGMIFVFAILMLVIIATTSAGALLNRLFSSFPLSGPTQFVIGIVIALIAALLLFTTLFLVFPNTNPRFKFENVWRGALVSAVLFEALSFIWPLYAGFAHFHRYGAVLFPILLLTAWIYFFSLILMIGAEFIAFGALREANREHRSIGPAPENSVPQHEVLRMDFQDQPAGNASKK
jgi:membrane protein